MSYSEPRKRKTKREKIAQSKELRIRRNRLQSATSVGLILLFFLGLVLNIFSNIIYQNTVVDWKFPALLWLLSGLVFLPFIKPYLESTGNYVWLMQAIYSVGAFGSIVTYTFMALNFYLPDTEERMVVAHVTKIGKLAKGRYGCANPYAMVEFGYNSKQLIFPCNFVIHNYKQAELILCRGLLGFDVIKEKELIYN